MKFILNLQLFASKKGVGSTRNGRDSTGRRLGAKRADGQLAKAGAILYRQRGTRIYPGLNARRGSDDKSTRLLKVLSVLNALVKHANVLAFILLTN